MDGLLVRRIKGLNPSPLGGNYLNDGQVQNEATGNSIYCISPNKPFKNYLFFNDRY